MMYASEPPIVVEVVYASPRQDVWRAITDVGWMQQWYFADLKSFETNVGFRTEFDVEVDDKVYRHLWNVVEAEEPRVIAYHWKFEGIDGEGKTTWLLDVQDAGTRLTLTNEVLSDFVSDDPAFQKESCEAGWDYFLNESLRDFLDANAGQRT